MIEVPLSVTVSSRAAVAQFAASTGNGLQYFPRIGGTTQALFQITIHSEVNM